MSIQLLHYLLKFYKIVYMMLFPSFLVDRLHYHSHSGFFRSITNELFDSHGLSQKPMMTGHLMYVPKVMEQSATCLTQVEHYQEIQKGP